MPNGLVRYKGPYTISKRNRRIEENLIKPNLNFLHRKTVQPELNIKQLLKITGFYLVLYSLIVFLLIFDGTLVYNLQIPINAPFQKKSTSLSSVPGNFEGNIKVIKYVADQRTITPYVEQLNDFVTKLGHEAFIHLRGCNLDGNWGYLSGRPCLLMKLNYAINFEPSTYTSASALPSDAPSDLYHYMLGLSMEDLHDRIWLSCVPVNNSTRVKVDYVPYRYYETQGLFTRGNVFINFFSENLTADYTYDNPAYRRVLGVTFQYVPMNQDFCIKCRAWAKNIPYQHSSIMFALRVGGYQILPNADPEYELDVDL